MFFRKDMFYELILLPLPYSSKLLNLYLILVQKKKHEQETLLSYYIYLAKNAISHIEPSLAMLSWIPWRNYLSIGSAKTDPQRVSENLGIWLVMRKNVKKFGAHVHRALHWTWNAIYLGVRNWNLAQNSQKHTDLPQTSLSYDTRLSLSIKIRSDHGL